MDYFEPSLIDRRWLKAKNTYYKYCLAETRASKLKQKWLKKYNYYVRAIERRDKRERSKLI